jgi:anti-anti-sigma regulatory factor
MKPNSIVKVLGATSKQVRHKILTLIVTALANEASQIMILSRSLDEYLVDSSEQQGVNLY